MRHAKSDWPEGLTEDHARPLNARGRRDAPHMGQVLLERGWIPDRILSSDATRTRETLTGLVSTWPEVPQTIFMREFYGAGIRQIESALEMLPTEVKSVMLLGHNPGWSEAVSWLSGQEAHLTTANIAVFKNVLDDWAHLAQTVGRWHLETILRPKEL